MCWYLGRISERFVIHRRERRDDILRISKGNVPLVMLGPEMLGYCLCKNGFVEPAFFEPYRKGFHATGRVGLIKCYDERGIDTAGEKSAHRHIGYGLTRD